MHYRPRPIERFSEFPSSLDYWDRVSFYKGNLIVGGGLENGGTECFIFQMRNLLLSIGIANLKPTPRVSSILSRPFLKKLSLTTWLIIGAQLLLPSLGALHAGNGGSGQAQGSRPANILFFILDDAGIDQLKSFNPAAPQVTPVMNTLVKNGVSFNNCWMMPECSPSRACLFTGRYPLRTGVKAAILDYNLPDSQVSPYEVTTPRVLAQAGYVSAMIGKYHLGGPNNNPAGIGAPAALGWDYYNGCLVGGPPYIDPTLGGQTANKALYPCGFPTGAARGVGWFQDAQNNISCKDNNGAGYTGQEIVQAGGIPALDASGNFATDCSLATIQPDFTINNGYYAWTRTLNLGTKLSRQSLARKYMVTAQTDDAISWIKSQRSSRKPWMCTVSYSAIHAPYQQPPTNLYPPGFSWPANVPEGNTTNEQIRIISNLMLYAMDQEMGRLLIGAGLAKRLPSGGLEYLPANTDTMIIVCGDNGTYYDSVRLPYNPLRSKATPYQTGISAPVIIAGPMVRRPNRTVTAMVNAVDLFQLFGEIAGLNVRRIVPPTHTLDCESMLGYLIDPAMRPVRRFNYAELGGAVPPNVQTWPSVFTIAGQKIGNDILFDNQQTCEDEGGEWFGPGAPLVLSDSCDVRAQVYPDLICLPHAVWTVRNDRYKLVKSELATCDDTKNPYEFYDLKPTLLNPVGLDNSPFDLLTKTSLTPAEQKNYTLLQAELNRVLNSEPASPGDGNLDKRVNNDDIQGVIKNWGQPSVFDFDDDGTTNDNDLQIVRSNLGNVYFPVPRVR